MMMPIREIIDSIVCPVCKGPLSIPEWGVLACSRCAKDYEFNANFLKLLPNVDVISDERWKSAQEAESEFQLCCVPPTGDYNVGNFWELHSVSVHSRACELMGLEPGHSFDRTLDIGGAGIPRVGYFPAVVRFAIDPLTELYIQRFPANFETIIPIEGIGEHLPFPDESLDMVVISNTLDHCSDPGRVLDEILRVLSPEGLCFLANNTYLPAWKLYLRIHGDQAHPFHFSTRDLQKLLAEHGADIRDFTVDPPEVRACYDENVRGLKRNLYRVLGRYHAAWIFFGNPPTRSGQKDGKDISIS